jgi:hypothetical protein
LNKCELGQNVSAGISVRDKLSESEVFHKYRFIWLFALHGIAFDSIQLTSCFSFLCDGERVEIDVE